MDGTLAILFLLTGLIDMFVNHCDRGCVKPTVEAVRHVASAGALIFEADSIGGEAYYRYDAPISFGPFRPTVGVSFDTLGDVWVGVGAVNEFRTPQGPAYAELSFIPGWWMRSEGGPVLGYPLEFRSGIEAGFYRESGGRVGVSLDHRSNGELSDPVPNPGLETLLFRYAQ
ncbi:acyloxyacyl hydrolase [Aliiroseovarius sp. F20344]|uniref:acyloxyacyl hydrolase n=1 Tax=Aliiroseovarius sp. F20344 TaxID=2926414 RepID=UPI001FF0E46A|nr:acyloxyacyl hydrolase [Aliiroseovarius sp. F20344]MCK0144024.1 acyloxyacyl hydrolase [Aliiroseovarius sp. F20344]